MTERYHTRDDDVKTDHPVDELKSVHKDMWHGHRHTRIAIIAGACIVVVLAIVFMVMGALSPMSAELSTAGRSDPISAGAKAAFAVAPASENKSAAQNGGNSSNAGSGNASTLSAQPQSGQQTQQQQSQQQEKQSPEEQAMDDLQQQQQLQQQQEKLEDERRAQVPSLLTENPPKPVPLGGQY